MLSTSTIAAPVETQVAFGSQKHGYDKQQVDHYVEMLAEAYQTAYENYTAVRGKYANLLEDYAKLERQSKLASSNASAITKTLLDAEVLARGIIDSAHKEAEAIKADARAETLAARRNVEATREYLLQTISNLQKLCQGDGSPDTL